MAYSIMKIDCSNHSNRIEYLCDKMSDVENLPTSSKNGKDLNSDNITNQPCAISSVALCIYLDIYLKFFFDIFPCSFSFAYINLLTFFQYLSPKNQCQFPKNAPKNS